MTATPKARIAAVLGEHIHYGAGECRCGWGKDADTDKSIEQFWEHQAAVIAALPDIAIVNRDTAKRTERIVGRMKDLLAGGPDTPVRTTWPNGIECWEIPADLLRDALDAGEG